MSSFGSATGPSMSTTSTSTAVDDRVAAIVNNPMNGSEYNEVILALKIISKLADHQKIHRNADGSIGVDDSGIFSGVRRMTSGDDRRISIRLIEEKINDAITYTNKLLTTDRSGDALKAVAEHLRKISDGLEAQMATYTGDTVVVSQLEVIQERALTRSKQIDKFISDEYGVSSAS